MRAEGAAQVEVRVAGPDDWARWRALRLEVHETNLRARAAYARLGFVETGATVPYPLEPGGLEVEMVLALDAGGG